MSETNTNQNGWPTEQKRIDPGIDPITAAHNNMRSIVDKVSSATLTELTQLRDEIDTLMIAIRNRNEEIMNDITRYTEFCVGAIKTKQILNDSVKAIQQDFNGNGQSILTVKQNDKH